MISVLFLGFLIGMQHALEADHVAAVSAIATRQKTTRRIIAHGAVWGLGHTITLMIVAGGAFWFGKALSPELAMGLEMAVGVMLVVLGGSVLYRLWRERVHYHAHRHDDGKTHFHAHTHAADVVHDSRSHAHEHRRGIPYRTLLVGMMHGMAGSAALLVLTASSVVEPGRALIYIALFGFGSLVGMAALSTVIAVPLQYAARTLTWGHRVLQGGVGAATIALGVFVLVGQ